MRNFCLLTLKALGCGVLAAAFGSLLHSTAQSATPAPAGKTFTFRMLGDPETLDWNKAHTPIETHVLMNLMEGLLTYDSSFKIAPALAKSYTISEDGRTYTFKLRSDVKWSDGVPMKADQFVYSWKRLLSPVTAASYAYLLFDIQGAEYFFKGAIKDFSQVGIKALDDFTLQVKLARPVAHWIHIPTFWVTYPMRQDIVERNGSGWAKPGAMVTLGPYTLSGYDHDVRIVMKANPNYYGAHGNVDQVVGLIVKDDSTALSLYESGKFDFLTDISTVDLKRLSGRPDLKAYPHLKTGYLGFSVNKYPVSNPKFRRAIAMAIDKKKIPQFLHGGQEPATSFVPPRMMGHSKNIGLPFDPVKAKAELRASGVDVSRGLTLDLISPNWDKALTLVQFLQNELKTNLGLTVTLQTFDHKTFREQLDLHTFPLFELSWSADYPDPDNFMSMWMSNAGNNRAGWKSEAYDERVLEARNITNQATRQKAYLDVQRMLIEEQAVIIPLYYEPNMALVRPRAKGLELNPLNYLLLKKVTLTD